MTSSSLTSTTVAGPTVQADPSTIAAGQLTVVSGHGFAGGSQLFVNLFSNPVLLATTTADSLGNLQVTVTIPAGMTPGTHAIAVAPASGSPRAATLITVTVTATAADGGTISTTVPSELSFTGNDARGPVLLATALLLAGLAGLAIGQARRGIPIWGGMPSEVECLLRWNAFWDAERLNASGPGCGAEPHSWAVAPKFRRPG